MNDKKAFRVSRIVVGKGISRELNEHEWAKHYYEIEVEITDEYATAQAKKVADQWLDTWLERDLGQPAPEDDRYEPDVSEEIQPLAPVPEKPRDRIPGDVTVQPPQPETATDTEPLEEWDPKQLEWLDRTGQKGPYELCEDFNNPHFPAMLKEIAHTTKKGLVRGKFYYWVFQNGHSVGRKLLKHLKRGRR